MGFCEKLEMLEKVMSEMESVAYNRANGRDGIAVSCDYPALRWQELAICKEEIMGREDATQMAREMYARNAKRARES